MSGNDGATGGGRGWAEGDGHRGAANGRGQIPGTAPIHRYIADIVAGGVVAGRVNGQDIVGGHGKVTQLRTVAERALDNANGSNGADTDTDGTGGIIQQGGMIGGDLPGSGSRGGQGGGDSGPGAQRSNAAADAPIHRNVLDIVVIRIKTGGMHGELLIRGQADGLHFSGLAAGAGQNFHMMRRPLSDRNGTRGVVRCRGMVGNDGPAGRGRCGAKCRARSRPADHRRQGAGTAPRYAHIADIIAGGIIAGGVYLQHVIGGETARPQFGAVSLRALHNFHIRQRPGIDRNDPGGVVDERGVVGRDLTAAYRRGGERCAGPLSRTQRADAAAHAPVHRNIPDVVVVSVKAAGVHNELVIGGQTGGGDFRGIAGRIRQDFDMMRCTHRNGQKSRRSILRRRMHCCNGARPNGIGKKCGGNGVGRVAEIADTAGHLPVGGLIGDVVFPGIVAGRMQIQRLVGGQG